MPKILIIGNGFDLANGLPTKYSDFLNFCKAALSIKENTKTYKEVLKTLSNEIQELFKDYEKGLIQKEDEKLLDDLLKCIKKKDTYNVWYKVFIESKTLTGENWIDFESEIANQIKKLDSYFSLISDTNKGNIEIPQILNNINSKIKDSIDLRNPKAIQDINQILSDDLKRITRALEIYLSAFAVKVKAKNFIQFDDNVFDYILSFNYTNTIERLQKEHGKKYINNLNNICYIHGKADVKGSVDKCNLVLGIEEYLKGEEKDNRLEYIGYKKYYQRIIKETDNNYFNWIDEITSKKSVQFEVYIFGHSLDITDKDILKKFIKNDNVITHIYYHRRNAYDKSNYSEKVKNLIKVIGQKELITRTSGMYKTIEFEAQAITNVGGNISGVYGSGGNWTNADLCNAIIKYADLSYANLSYANLSGADLTESDLTGAILTGANLKDSTLTGTNLTGANLINADLTGTILIEANLTQANLSINTKFKPKNLYGAKFIETNFGKTDLRRVKFINCDLEKATFDGNDMRSADFSGANLTGVDLNNISRLQEAIYCQSPNCKTIFPDDFNPEKHGMIKEDCINEFRNYLKNSHISHSTIASYCSKINKFCSEIKKTPTELKECIDSILKKYDTDDAEEKINKEILSALKFFQKFAEQNPK